MDDIWQRHKTFIVQCVVGGLVFLIALLVKSNVYDGIGPMQAKANTLKGSIQKSDAPDTASIRAQEAQADLARKNIAALAGTVASLETGDAYVRESLTACLTSLGIPGKVNGYFGRYKELPLACLSQLSAEMRSILNGRAARLGKEIDETMGFRSGFEEAEVPAGIHGLAIVAEVVKRALDIEGIESVESLTISPRPRRRVGLLAQDGARANVFSVKVQLVGEPDAVLALINSFNALDNPSNRLVVVDSVEYVQRIRAEEDTMKASLNLFGIQYRGLEGNQ